MRPLVLLVLLSLPAGLSAQAPVPVKEETPGLLARARVTPDSAWNSARVRIPGGRAVEAEIELEHGRLTYSFDFRVGDRPGIEEVQVDAITGLILGVEHEDAASEAREKAAETPRKPA